jgi:3-methylcrotonyl-CoA carboxylase beta subunit
MDKIIQNLSSLRAKAREGGGPAVLERWKARGKGKLGARER